MLGGGIRKNRPFSATKTDAQRKPKERNVAPSSLTHTIPPFPDFLKLEGQRRWVAYCETLIDKGILSKDYYHALGQLCKLHDQLDYVETKIRADGLVQYTGYQKTPKVHPLAKLRNDLMAMIRGAMQDFGLTPASSRNANVPTTAPGGVKAKGVASRLSAYESEEALFADN